MSDYSEAGPGFGWLQRVGNEPLYLRPSGAGTFFSVAPLRSAGETDLCLANPQVGPRRVTEPTLLSAKRWNSQAGRVAGLACMIGGGNEPSLRGLAPPMPFCDVTARSRLPSGVCFAHWGGDRPPSSQPPRRAGTLSGSSVQQVATLRCLGGGGGVPSGRSRLRRGGVGRQRPST